MKPAPPVTSALPFTSASVIAARARERMKTTRTRYLNPYPDSLRCRYIGAKMGGGGSGGVALGEREVRMPIHRRLVAVAAGSLLAVLCAGSAYAATPQTIYRDLADNGKLDGRYTQAEIKRAFDLPSVLGTDERLPRKPIREPQAHEAAPQLQAARKADRRIPFSALDAALLVAGGAPLLLIGAGLRRRLSEPSNAQVVGG